MTISSIFILFILYYYTFAAESPTLVYNIESATQSPALKNVTSINYSSHSSSMEPRSGCFYNPHSPIVRCEYLYAYFYFNF